MKIKWKQIRVLKHSKIRRRFDSLLIPKPTSDITYPLRDSSVLWFDNVTIKEEMEINISRIKLAWLTFLGFTIKDIIKQNGGKKYPFDIKLIND
ncbi:MAG: hypothetical protein DU489_06960 [Nitrosomonas sp.]|uniref:hypothetical protein n=1 Tax=Nitrosomonas sp. TaxID=42353 RepID=UPI0032ED2ECD